MKVTAKVALPQDAPITITIEATLGELQGLGGDLGTARRWSKLAELLASAIRQASSNLQEKAEQVVEVAP